MDYEKQAEEFADRIGLKMELKHLRHGLYFPDDKHPRDVYEITLTRGRRSYKFEFGQSIAKSLSNPVDYVSNPKGGLGIKVKRIPPTLYDVLSCLTKYNPYTFEDFCSEYGYDIDSRKAYKTFEAVREEWYNVEALFDDVLEELREIN